MGRERRQSFQKAEPADSDGLPGRSLGVVMLRVPADILTRPVSERRSCGYAQFSGMAGTRRRAKRFALYWCTTADGDEDWFVVAHSPREAKRFHEDVEGYERGDADAERVALLPPELQTDGGWKDAADGGVQRSAGWPSDQVLVACGGEIANQPRGGLRDEAQVVCKDVRFGERVFRAGDIVSNVQRSQGIREARLSMFKGGKGT